MAASSLFSDSGHELTTALLPSFLISVLHASAGTLGVIEGISDGLLGLAQLVSGPIANDRNKRGRLASGGYLITAVATGAIGLSVTIWQAGTLRALAWVARGARSPARTRFLLPWPHRRPRGGRSGWNEQATTSVLSPVRCSRLLS